VDRFDEVRIIRRRRRLIRRADDDTETTEHDMVCFVSIPIRQLTFSFRVHRIRPFQLRRSSRRQQQQQDDQFLFYLQWRAQYYYHPPADNDDSSSSSAAIDVEFEMDDDFVTVERLALHSTVDGRQLSKDEILTQFIGNLDTFKDPPLWDVDDDGDWFRVAKEQEENDDRRVWTQIATTTTTNHHPLLADDYRNRGVTVHPIQVSYRFIQNQVVKGLRPSSPPSLETKQ
jgi:hypothetical protein